MFEFVLIAIAAVICIFFYSRRKQKQTPEAGVKEKYKSLVGGLMDGSQRARILKENSDFIAFGVSSLDKTTVFRVTATSGQVAIEWQALGSFGEENLEWRFDTEKSQKKMLIKIKGDLSEHESDSGESGVSADPPQHDFWSSSDDKGQEQEARIKDIRLDRVREKLDLDDPVRPDILRAARGVVTGRLDDLEKAKDDLFRLPDQHYTLSELDTLNKAIFTVKNDLWLIREKAIQHGKKVSAT